MQEVEQCMEQLLRMAYMLLKYMDFSLRGHDGKGINQRFPTLVISAPIRRAGAETIFKYSVTSVSLRFAVPRPNAGTTHYRNHP